MGVLESLLKRKMNKYENRYTPKNIYMANREGTKKDMKMVGQDVPQIIGYDIDNCSVRYIAVYDGHGEKGRVAADFVAREVDEFLFSNKGNFHKWNSLELITKKFTKFFKEVQQKMFNDSENFDQSGTCAVCCLTIDKNCYVINIGDSRCVIGGRNGDSIIAIQMSEDHKPNNPEEEERIKKNKGEVINYRDNNFGPFRVYKEGESNPGLAVSRSLGDLAGHEVGCSEIPEVSLVSIDPCYDFVILGSDGVWDMMGSAEIVAYIYERLDDIDRTMIADAVVDECRLRWGVINKYKDNLVKERYEKGDMVPIPTKSPHPKFKDSNPKAVHNFTGLHITIDDITCVIHYFK